MAFKRAAKILAAVSLAALGLSACASVPAVQADGNYVRPIGSAPVTSNPTPYSASLACVASYGRSYGRPAPSIAVGRIMDYTGQLDPTGTGSSRVTQGAALMAMTAFGKAGFPLVERFDTAVMSMETELANGQRGQTPASDYYLVGGITELNADIRAVGADASYEKSRAASLSNQVLVMNVGIDLRLIDSHTLRVIDMVSYQKQVVSKSVGLGLFDVLGGGLVNVSASASGSEPLQLVVRALIERGVTEMAAGLYGMPSPAPCLTNDPIGGRSYASASSATASASHWR
jgi:curli production assembly/transport component CsgG/holdfast attachment protein HfaB